MRGTVANHSAQYVGRLRAHGLDVITPDEGERAEVHRIIYDELCQDLVPEPSRDRYRDVMQHLVQRGAQGIILGCTEIGLLVKSGDASVPCTTRPQIHAQDAVDWMLTA